jgi:hypothetical protein
MNKLAKLIILSGFFMIAPLSLSGVTYSQKDYQFTINNDTIDFNYSWLNMANQINYIKFKLDKVDVAKSYIDFKRPETKDVVDYIHARLLMDINIINTSQNDYKIQIIKASDQDDFSFLITGDTKNKLDRIRTVLEDKQQEYYADYFHEHFYNWNKDEKLISIDYNKITELYLQKMAPIAKAFQLKNNNQIYDKRSVINDILNFYQSLPYDTLMSDRGAGFSTPFKLLHENKGDCDTKLVASAATIKSLYKDVKVISVVLPEHVIIGFNVPATSSDLKIMYKGSQYVLAETAGPGLIPLGELSEFSLNALKRGDYAISPL